MTNTTKITLSAIIAAIAISASAPAYAGPFTGTITSERETVIDHRDDTDRRNEIVPARRGTDPSKLIGTLVLPTTPTTPTPTPPGNGGINPVGDVSCFDGQLILFQDGFEVTDSNCFWFIYKFRAIKQDVLVEIGMSSFDGTYNTKILGFVH